MDKEKKRMFGDRADQPIEGAAVPSSVDVESGEEANPAPDQVNEYLKNSPAVKMTDVYQDAKGNEVKQPIVYFDEDSYKKGFLKPFVITIKAGDTREEVHKAILDALNAVKGDKELKHLLINTYCNVAREDNRVFNDEETLRDSVKGLTDAVNAAQMFKEETRPAAPLPRRSSLSSGTDFEERANAETSTSPKRKDMNPLNLDGSIPVINTLNATRRAYETE